MGYELRALSCELLVLDWICVPSPESSQPVANYPVFSLNINQSPISKSAHYPKRQGKINIFAAYVEICA